MNVTSIVNLYRSQDILKSGSATSTDPLQKAFSAAATRLEQQRQSTGVQISALGAVKSGFSKIEDTGKALASSKPATAAETKSNLQALVAAYNNTRAAGTAASESGGNSAVSTLRKTLASDSNRADLRSLGITQNQDGSLSLDTKKLDAALQTDLSGSQATASRVGSQFQQTATSALAGTGSLNNALGTLNAKADSIEALQTSQKKLADNALSSIQQQSDRISHGLSSGVSSYLNIFSL